VSTEEKMFYLLGELKGSQDRMIAMFEQHFDDDKKMAEDIERIKKKINYAAGAYAAFIGIFTYAFNWFMQGGSK